MLVHFLFILKDELRYSRLSSVGVRDTNAVSLFDEESCCFICMRGILFESRRSSGSAMYYLPGMDQGFHHASILCRRERRNRFSLISPNFDVFLPYVIGRRARFAWDSHPIRRMWGPTWEESGICFCGKDRR